MQQLDGLRPARLKVGIISAGRVGSAIGAAQMIFDCSLGMAVIRNFVPLAACPR